MIAILPMLVLLIFVVVIGLLISKMKFWKPRYTFWFMLVFFMLGIASFIGVTVLSAENQIQSKAFLKEQNLKNETINDQLRIRNYDVLEEGYLKFTKTLEATAENIEIIRNEASQELRIVIEWNDSKDNEIVASYYETPLYINRIDISDKVYPPVIELEKNKLLVQGVTPQIRVNSSRMTLDLVNRNFENSDELSSFIGLRILHLNVPRHFNIIDNSGWIN